MDTFHTMIVNTNGPISNSSAIPSLVSLVLDPYPEHSELKILSKDQGHGDEEKGALLRYGGVSPDAECKQTSKKRRLACSTASSSDEERDDRIPDGALASSQQTLASKKDDPFLYFSNNKRRLEHLLGKELPHIAPPEEPVKRKTRISFEVDPLFDIVSNYPEVLDQSYSDASDSDGEDIHMSLINELESFMSFS